MLQVNLEKVKKAYKSLLELGKECGYQNLEVAQLLLDRVDNILDNEDSITQEMADKVFEISQSVDTLYDEYINDKLLYEVEMKFGKK